MNLYMTSYENKTKSNYQYKNMVNWQIENQTYKKLIQT